MPIRLQLTGMAHGGEALGRHEGKVIFVPYALPGEEAVLTGMGFSTRRKLFP